MNKYLALKGEMDQLYLGEEFCQIEGDTVDLRDINIQINSSITRYQSFKVNVEHRPDEFTSHRNIKKCNLNVIDLFCGAGGSSSGFKLAGFNLVGALDNNAKAAATHELNFPMCKTIVGDITKLTPEEFDKKIGSPRVDIVIGSPPCQTFSSLSQGKIKSLGKDIKEDIRNYFIKTTWNILFLTIF